MRSRKKVDLTGAISSIGSDALKDRPLTNATNALAGLASGLSVSNSGGNTPGFESQSILVRGQGTLNNSAPLVVVDGMTGIALSDINPQDIENISVLKDAASSAIYGSRAANGVILVTTRQGAEESPRVTYSGNVSFETVAKRLNLVTDYADFMEIQNAGLIATDKHPASLRGRSTNGATMPDATPPSIPTPTGRTISTEIPRWYRTTIYLSREDRNLSDTTYRWATSTTPA